MNLNRQPMIAEKFDEDSNKPSLSKREMDVILLVKEGYGNTEIAEKLGLSIKTIENHMRSIFLKLKAKNRTEAVVIAVKNSLIDI